MSERFFVEQPINGSHVTLTGDEARHLAVVMRARVGDEATLFDGSGDEFAARVVACGKGAVELEVVERRSVSRELPFSLTLAVALPRKDRQQWLVEKATELGVTRLVPLATERGVAQVSGQVIQRLTRYVSESCKQCGRNRLMAIDPPQPSEAYFQSVGGDTFRLLADREGAPLASAMASQISAGNIYITVGPEGGLTETEVAAAKLAGWLPVSLGPRTLRVETAAIALAAWAVLANETQ